MLKKLFASAVLASVAATMSLAAQAEDHVYLGTDIGMLYWTVNDSPIAIAIRVRCGLSDRLRIW